MVQSPSPAMRSYGGAAIVFGLSLLFYLKTLAPTVVWGDPAKLAVTSHQLLLSVGIGNHPLRNMVGWVWGHLMPFQDYFFEQNLLSAVLSAVALVFLYLAALQLTRSVLASLLAVLSLAVAHTYWWLAVVSESYALLWVFLAAALWGGLRWRETGQRRWLFGIAVCFGLGFSDHKVMFLFAPAFALLILLHRPRTLSEVSTVALVVGGLLLGLLPFIGTFLLELQQAPWQHVINKAFLQDISIAPGGRVRLTLSGPEIYEGPRKIAEELAKYPAYLLYQFPSPAYLLGLLGAVSLFRKERKLFSFTASLVALDVFFASGWLYTRQPEVTVPSYIVYSLFVAEGAQSVRIAVANRIMLPVIFKRTLLTGGAALLVVAPPVFYGSMPSATKALGVELLSPRTIPYRDNARYFYLPDKSGYDGARRYGEEVFRLAEPGSLIIGDFTPLTVLLYLQDVEGMRPDVELLGADLLSSSHLYDIKKIDQTSTSRAVYLLDIDDYEDIYRVDYFSERHDFVPVGPMYKLVRKP